ncbi:MAG: GNAT family N-acetyltransferase [Anaerolineae bacterium]|nr:GNAT family N-acetyltransferase [Anaerolineae bacterium]
MDNDYKIRPANPQDIPSLPEIERAAGELFASCDLVQDLHHTVPIGELERAQKAGRLWVATGPEEQPVGFALVTVVDGLAHLDELDVHPEHGRRGLGAALVETVCEWATSSEFKAITLSTFRDVPWNAPFYTRLGFHILTEDELTEGLLRLREAEVEWGLPISERVVMRRELWEQ